MFRKLWYYPLRLFRRPITFISSGVTVFFLLLVICLSLILLEGQYLGALTQDFSGRHYGMFYHLSESQYRTLLSLDIEADITAVPVYGVVKSLADDSPAAYITVLTEELAAYYNLQYTAASWVIQEQHQTPPSEQDPAAVSPGHGEILLPLTLYRTEKQYDLDTENTFFLQGQNRRGEKQGRLIMYPLTITRLISTNHQQIPYAFCDSRTAGDILNRTGGELTYDIYFTTPHPSDYAVAQVVDALLAATDWNSADQVLVENAKVREQKYGDFINYDFLDKVTANYMWSPSFFIQVLPVILASALVTATLLKEDTETHLREYGLLAATGADTTTLFGMLYTTVFSVMLTAMIPALAVSSLIAWLFMNTANELLAAYAIPYTFGIPFGNLVLVCLYYLICACVLLYWELRHLFRMAPYSLLHHTGISSLPYVRRTALRILNVRDKVGYMGWITFRRGWKRHLQSAAAVSLLMGVCGYLLMTNGLSLRGDTSTFLADCILYTNWEHSAGLPEDTVQAAGEVEGIASAGAGKWLTPHPMGNTPLSLAIPVEQMSLWQGSRQYYSGETSRTLGSGMVPLWQGNYLQPVSVFACDRVLGGYLTEEQKADCSRIWEDVGTVALVMEEKGPYVPGDTITLVHHGLWPNPKGELSIQTELLESSGYDTEDAVHTLTIGAILSPIDLPEGMTGHFGYNLTANGSILCSPETAEMLGFTDEYGYLLVRYEDTADSAAVYRSLTTHPALVRYQSISVKETDAQAAALAAADTRMRLLFTGILYAAFLTLTTVLAGQTIRRSRHEYALIRQLGGGNRDIRRQALVLQTCRFLMALLVTAFLFLLLVWFVLFFITQEPSVLQQIFIACGYACLLQGINLFFGQAAILLPLRRILAADITSELRKRE